MPLFVKHRSIIFFTCLFCCTRVFSQGKDSTKTGSVNGTVKDTALNYFLQAATVSVNMASDGRLVTYTMTNPRGEFHLKTLPTGVILQISISYVGYKTNSRVLVIPVTGGAVSFGEVHLEKRPDNLEDSVVVTPPPVQMKGDTLEFSAAAFSLDKNAVAEDLLKKLPGVIIWGDGAITVNGKPISKLLVDGKPFFSGDTKVATQNIPKNAIDKIQVYQEQANLLDPFDSTTTINIKLRRGRHSGYFGAVSAGGGTDDRYELGVNSSIFSPRSQFAIAGQGNNINKVANDLPTLLRNNTYKGVGVHVEYQPDFNLQGRNQPSSGGFFFSHDLVPIFDNYEKNRLTANTLVNHNINETQKNTQTVSYVGKDSTLKQDMTDNQRGIFSTNELTIQYLKHKDENTLSFDAGFKLRKFTFEDSLRNELHGPDGSLTSGDIEHDSSMNTLNTFGLRSLYEHKGFSSTMTRKLTDWSIVHDLSVDWGSKDSSLQRNFTNVLNPALNGQYDRKYDNDVHAIRQSLAFSLGDFSAWLFGGNRTLSNFHIQFKNDLKFDVSMQDNHVMDRDRLSHSYGINGYLTTNSRYTMVNEMPDLRFGRSLMNILANRYTKEFSVYIDARGQVYGEKNVSVHPFQRLDNRYGYFVPKVSIDYSNFQYGTFLDKYGVDFVVSYDLPGVDQRVPLIDSSNIYNIRAGNAALLPMKTYELSARFRHDSYRSKNAFAYGANLTAGIKNRYFADSAIIDLLGRYTYYTVNIDGNRYLTLNLVVNKAFVYNSHQFQVNFGSFSLKSSTPGYLQYEGAGKAIFNTTGLFTNSDTLSLFYTYKDLVAVNLVQGLVFFNSEQRGLFNSALKNTQMSSKIGIGVNLTKRLSLNSNVTYTSSVTSGAAAYRYTIWNASMAYRFLPANNLEVKASALDLLNQNKGVINYGNNLSFTHGTVNMLRQYFMLTATYFPRKFGKK